MAFKPYELEPAISDRPVKSEITESVEKKLKEGKALREEVTRESHAEWIPPSDRRDPIDILIESNKGRLEELVPIRHGRMMISPFTFLRGSASVMAYDLSHTPTTGQYVQACGDCHLSNFGLFATPERNLIFDVNDFDETIPGPWEWDLKRLVASVYVAYKQSGFSDNDAFALSVTCAKMYRRAMRRAAGMTALEIWYMQLNIGKLFSMAKDPEVQKRVRMAEEASKNRVHEFVMPKISEVVDGHTMIIDEPPLVRHFKDKAVQKEMREVLSKYRKSLSHSHLVLFDRYKLEDMAMKVVGVGSVGTRCAIILMMAKENDPLLLQVKEARESVLQPYVKKSDYKNNGQRVVVGQRIMQSASDIFLGFTHYSHHDFYIRQLKDMKISAVIESQPYAMADFYVRACALILAKAHARSGDPAIIAGYLGKGTKFDYALGNFAKNYYDQTVNDHKAMLEAVNSGRIEALPLM